MTDISMVRLLAKKCSILDNNYPNSVNLMSNEVIVTIRWNDLIECNVIKYLYK